MSFVNPYEPDPRSLSFTGSYVESWRFSFILLLLFVLYEVDVIFFISLSFLSLLYQREALFDILLRLLAGVVGDFCCLMMMVSTNKCFPLSMKEEEEEATLSRTTTTTTTKGERERERERARWEVPAEKERESD